MVPLDGSLLAERALAAVHRVFGKAVRLHLVRIVEPVAPGHAYAPETVAEYEITAREGAEEYLRRTAGELTDQGVTVTWDVRAAAPAPGITDVAEELDVDLIAMTTHGRSGIGRFLLGSVVERVLHDARQPLMVIRAQEVRDADNADVPPLV
jgi:nucleotide-binding universal stress UspA family protein